MTETLQACLQPTYKMVAKLINIELAYINTRHPDFVRVLPTAEAHFDAGGVRLFLASVSDVCF